MSEKYKEAMDKIVVSEELKARVINNTMLYAKRKKSKPLAISYLRYAVSYAACFALCLYAVSTNEPYIENINKVNDGIKNADYLPVTSEAPIKNEVQDTVGYDVAYASNQSGVKKNPPPKQATNLKSKKSAENYSYSDKNSYSLKSENKSEPINAIGVVLEENNSIGVQSTLVEDVASEFVLPITASVEPNGADGVAAYSADGYMLRSVTEPKIKTLTDIENTLGHRVKIPHYMPEDYKVDSMGVIAGDVVQILYSAPDDEITYRTEKNTNGEEKDISGNFEEYERVEDETVNDNTVTVKSDGDSYYNAVWNDESAYSVDSVNGIEKDDMLKIVESVDYSDYEEDENTELE